MTDTHEDPPLNRPAIILLAVGVLGALIVGMGNMRALKYGYDPHASSR
jgi:hypothetical protein